MRNSRWILIGGKIQGLIFGRLLKKSKNGRNLGVRFLSTIPEEIRYCTFDGIPGRTADGFTEDISMGFFRRIPDGFAKEIG